MVVRNDTSFHENVVFYQEFDNESYYAFKLYELLLAESHLKGWIEEYPVLSTYNFLNGFLDLIYILIEKQFLSDSIKENILRYLVLVRFNEDERVKFMDEHSFEEKVNLINKIMQIVKLGKGTNYIKFYQEELVRRTDNQYYLLENVDGKEKDLFESMKLDQQVIYSHSSAVTDEQFISYYISYFIKDLKYFQTINCILAEYPRQFNDPLFVQRYNKMISSFLKSSVRKPKTCASILCFDLKVKNVINSFNNTDYSKKISV